MEADGCVQFLQKADIDSAYRRIPLAMSQTWAANVFFACDGRVYISDHIAMQLVASRIVLLVKELVSSCVVLLAVLCICIFSVLIIIFVSANPRNYVVRAMTRSARLVRCLL